MAIFDFIKEAGEAAKAGKTEEFRMTQVLKAKLDGYGLKVDNPEIDFDNGVVTIGGQAANRATREKIILTLGNMAGVSRVVDKMTVYKAPVKADAVEECVEEESRFYTVVKGDTLSKIAKAHYGEASKYPVIFEANKPMLKDPNLIYPGQVLRIPPLA